jgi:hypothetical protein
MYAFRGHTARQACCTEPHIFWIEWQVVVPTSHSWRRRATRQSHRDAFPLCAEEEATSLCLCCISLFAAVWFPSRTHSLVAH